MIIKIILSVLLGCSIGFERERCGKAVGSRTLALICLGSTMFCLMSPELGDNSRIVAQIVSGIGFLGAGIIFKNGDTVHGLTTAATIWASAAIGALIGMNMFIEAVLGAAAIIMINLGFRFFKSKSKNNQSDN